MSKSFMEQIRSNSNSGSKTGLGKYSSLSTDEKGVDPLYVNPLDAFCAEQKTEDNCEIIEAGTVQPAANAFNNDGFTLVEKKRRNKDAGNLNRKYSPSSSSPEDSSDSTESNYNASIFSKYFGYSLKPKKDTRENACLQRVKDRRATRVRNLARQKGRFHPQGGLLFDEHDSMENSDSKISCLLSKISYRTPDFNSRMTDVFVSVSAYIYTVLSSTSWNEVWRLTLTTLAQHFHMIKNLDWKAILSIDWLMEKKEYLPESGEAFTFTAALKKLQSGKDAILYSPLAGFFMNVIGMIGFVGCGLDSHLEAGYLKDFLTRIHKEGRYHLNKTGLLECGFGILGFVASLADCIISGGKVGDSVFTDNTHVRISDVLNHLKDVQTGKLYEDGNEVADALRNEANALVEVLQTLLKREPTGGRNVSSYMQYLNMLQHLLSNMDDYERSKKARISPIIVALIGDSQIGKSNMVDLVSDAIGAGFSRTYTPEQKCNLNPQAKYFSGWSTSHRVCLLDDVGGQKPPVGMDYSDMVMGAILQAGSNEPFMTNQAEAHLKGKIPFAAEAVIMTSNIFDLGLQEIYKDFTPIKNRVIFVHVKLLPEYVDKTTGQLDKKKAVKNTIDGVPPVMHECALATWTRVSIGPSQRNKSPCYEWHCTIGTFQRADMFMKWLAKHVHDHVHQQTALINNRELAQKIERCLCGGFKNSPWCTCAAIGLEPEFGVGFVDTEVLQEAVLDKWHKFSVWLPTSLMRWFLNSQFGGDWVFRRATGVVVYTGSRVFFNGLIAIFITLVLLMQHAYITRSYSRMSCYLSFLVVYFWILFITYCGLVRYCDRQVRRTIIRAVVQRCPTMPIKSVVGFGAALVTLKMLYDRLKKDELEPEGSLLSVTAASIAERRVQSDDWKQPSFVPPKVNDRLRTMTKAQVFNLINKCLFRLRIEKDDGTFKISCILLVESNIAIMPKHMLKLVDDKTQIIIYRDAESSKFTPYIVTSYCQEDSDVAFVELSSVPSVPCISHLFSDSPYEGLATYITRDRYTRGIVTVDTKCFVGRIASEEWIGILPTKGLLYSIPQGTSPGDCGSLLVSENTPHRIVGFHCAGKEGRSAANILTKRELEVFISQVRRPLFEPEGLEGNITIFGIGDDIDPSPFGQEPLRLDDPLDDRCFVNYLDIDKAGIAISGYQIDKRTKGFSQLRYSTNIELLEQEGIPIEFAPPVMRSDRAHSKILEERLQPMRDIYPPLLEHSINDYVAPLIDCVNAMPLGTFGNKPLSLYQALNGVQGNRFIKSINPKSSTGFGISGDRSQFFDTIDPGDGTPFQFHPLEIMTNRVDFLLGQYRTGKRCNPVVTTSLKDELVKIGEPRTPAREARIFYIYPVCDFVVMKMLFAPVIEVLSQFPFMSECMAAINTTRSDWTDAYEFLKAKGRHKLIEGDFSKYDVTMSGQLIRAAGCVLIKIAQAMGFGPTDLLAMSAAISDVACTHLLYQGCMLHVDGWQMSGTYLTLALNSIVNSLFHRCAFFRYFFEGTFPYNSELKYRDNVHQINMGDDSLLSVREDCPFSAVDIAQYAETIGVRYTTGDKHAVTTPYVDIETVTFCKRKWRWSDICGHYLAPLALSSILRTIYTFRLGPLSEKQCFIDALDNALRELARHEESVFIEWRNKIVRITDRLGFSHLVTNIEWTHSQWEVHFREKYFRDSEVSSLSEDEDSNYFELQSGNTTKAVYASDVHSAKIRTRTNWFTKSMSLTVHTLWLLFFLTGIVCFFTSPPWNAPKQIRTNLTQTKIKPTARIGSMQISDQNSSWRAGIDTAPDGLSAHIATSDSNDSFFSRPIRIATIPWSVNEGLFYEVNPWRVFFEDSRIANRLAHFRNLKSKLNIQVLVNGNPFYYGRAMMSYIPLPDADRVSRVREEFPEDMVEASQRPHIYLDPTGCEGGELELPFIWPKNALNITEREWRKMGLITIRHLNLLQHANNAEDPIFITILAYASETEVYTPTSRTMPNLEPQAGDEYGKISFPAHKIARLANALSNVPYIGNLARSTEMISTGIGNMASFFGYSKPRAIAEETTMNRHYGESTVVAGIDTSLTLAMDAKKEITIDQSILGLGPVDEMAFASIVQRESYLDTFVWSEADNVDNHLWSFRVSPICGREDILGDGHITPMTYVASLFEYWKGSIEVRVQVVASAYHRGRMRVVWDPDYVSQQETYNVNYSALIDITEATEVTFKIGWGQEYDYLPTAIVEDAVKNAPRDSQISFKDYTANGTLSFFVVNGLSSPSETDSSIYVNVFVKACDDFEVASPTMTNLLTMGPKQFDYRTPTDLDVEYDDNAVAAYTAFSRSTDPLRRDDQLKSGGIQVLAGPSDAYINGTFQMYSNVDKVYQVPFNFTSASSSTISLKIGGTTKIIPVAGSTPYTQNIRLKPGWNEIPFAWRSNDTDVDLVSIGAYTPVEYEWVTMYPNLIFDRISGSVVETYASQPDTDFVTIADGDVSVVTLDLSDAVPGRLATIAMTSNWYPNGSSQRLGELNVPPTAARMFTVRIPSNGQIQILRAPGSTQPLEITSVTYLVDENFTTESGTEEHAQESDTANAPMAVSTDHVMGPTAGQNNLNAIYFGENVVSMRQVLKRFQQSYFWNTEAASANAYTHIVIPHLPILGTNFTGVGVGYGPGNRFHRFVMAPFVCARGSMRVKVITARPLVSGNTTNISEYWGCERIGINEDRGPLYFTRSANDGLDYRRAWFSGNAFDRTTLKPYGEFELPWYSNFKFTQPRSYTDIRFEDNIINSAYRLYHSGLTSDNLITLNYASGEDFSLAFFLSTPVVVFT